MGGGLIALGAIALLLWTEHRVVQSSRDAGPLKQSVLERALMPDSLGKSPTWEGLDRWGHRIELAQRWIRWIIPAVGIVFCLGGFLLLVTSARGAAFSAMPDLPDA
jgi:hypothetical protein